MTFKRTRCPCCKGKLDPGQRIHPGCIEKYADDQAEKAKRKEEKQARMAAKVERAETRKRKEAIKTRADHLRETQALINKLVRERDRGDPCISCDKPSTWHGQWHASHYRSVGAHPALRFDLANIHKSCSICNDHLSGNIGEYRPRLIAKIGSAEVARLEQDCEPKKYTIQELIELKAWARSELKRMKNERGD